jgi:hypothetical protein
MSIMKSYFKAETAEMLLSHIWDQSRTDRLSSLTFLYFTTLIKICFRGKNGIEEKYNVLAYTYFSKKNKKSSMTE